MSVVLSVEDVGPCRKRLTVEVPAPAVEAETQRVVQELSRKARLPGFRKGKVPQSMVQSRFAEEIRQELVERLVPRYWRQAQAEKQLVPLLPPEFGEVEPPKAGEPLQFTATVEVRPEVELRNTRDFDLPEMPVEPSIDEIEREIENLRRQRSTWKTVERPAAVGDKVSAMLSEVGEDGTALGTPQEIEVEVGDPNVWEELSLALTGLAAGQNGRFDRHEHHEAGVHGEGTPAHDHDRSFRLQVTKVDERELPEVDDAFAFSIGKFPSLTALRDAIADAVRDGKRSERRRKRETAVLDQMRDRHPLALPEGVVRHETEHMLRDYAETLARQGVDLDHAHIDWQALARDVQPQAERRVHARILLDAVADAESIDVTESEFEGALASIARSQGKSTPAVRQALDQAGRLGTLRSQLRRDKTLARLLGETPAAAPAVAEE